jgi:hypothetical protein
MSWKKKQVRQKKRRKSSLRPVLRSTVGNRSDTDVITTSMATNWMGEECRTPLNFRDECVNYCVWTV